MRRPNLDALPDVPELPAGYVLREYQEQDRDELAELLYRAFDDDAWTPQKVQDSLIDAPDVKKTFVIAFQGMPVATASARLLPEQYPGSGYVHWVAADPAHKGQRLGYIASLAVLHEFVRLGCKDAVLETDDFRLPAIKVYRSLGFEPEHRHESHAGRWAEVISRILAAAGL